ncbi:MAG: aminotransferase class I/II-fold pyridoxal phosphate-dependent enzyme [Actinomycetaceae bacterium]|nr:aminotransferase class I/II-fold pyridoxal phosphate-dependent enzyme [Arcanobacterium sp.]MDD7505747.1 aminotransferase class I/II-fold pyridoxal phosphate-dependent enzyme [Actinomycetaceae bacterium]MDY6143654.1 aminotransferase class I/II-fold pyridoxal phosphate-dependent enzyme [Arcanobacterium sp.]
MSNQSSQWKFNTLQIHAGQAPDPTYGSRSLPIHQTTSFVFDSAEQAANRFALSDAGPIYSRITNPTVQAVEEKLAALEGGTSALLVASGQAAITFAVLNITTAGDHIVASSSLYGGTTNLFKHTLSQYGISVTFVAHPNDPEEWKAATKENTKLYFGESVPNPRGDVLDLEAIAQVAHSFDIPFIVDNTVPTPYLLRPFEWGADIVIHSVTKYLGGHGTTLGGVIIENGAFDWKNGKFNQFTEPDDSYHGIVWGDLGGASFTTRARAVLLRDIGASLQAIDAWIIGLGTETLSLRIERHCENALKIAQFLEGQEQVEAVAYASLPSSPYYELAQKYVPQGASGLLNFTLKGGRDDGEKFVDALELFSNLANIGDVRSLVVHPASTTHSQLTDEELALAGITPGTVRLSVGLEDAADLIRDLEKGFEAIR